MKIFPSLSIILLLSTKAVLGQPNCNLYDKDTNCHVACLELEKANRHYGGDQSFQKHLLTSIELCPGFHQAYFELSVNYAKRGLMHEWIKLIDKAVELSPKDHLGWRGWYHWFFMRNYEKAIADIDSLDALSNYDIGTTGDGLYHLNILKGLCYKGLGDLNKAIALIENTIANEEYYQGSYDYLHLGVLYLNTDQFEKALDAFEVQNSFNEISEVYYYSALVHWKLENTEKALSYLNLALEKYDAQKSMSDPYIQLPDKIYRSDILDYLNEIESK